MAWVSVITWLQSFQISNGNNCQNDADIAYDANIQIDQLEIELKEMSLKSDSL